jgi:hypothetical protein
VEQVEVELLHQVEQEQFLQVELEEQVLQIVFQDVQ